MDLSAFDYALPEELIAQFPLPDRAASRMLVVFRDAGRWEDRNFRDLPAFLRPGDCLALNDSKVFPSRLYGVRAGVHAHPVGKRNPARHENLSRRVEVFLLRPVSSDLKDWEALVRPGRRMRTGERIQLEGGLTAEILSRGEYGLRVVRFRYDGDIYGKLEEIGHVPLPPYIKRADDPADRERYQTVFARERGSVAAPTAGLHFTPEVLEECRQAGADVAWVTLHVGLGTFAPIHEEQLASGRLHPESYAITEENAARLRAAARVVAVGTTSVRAIESPGLRGQTDLFIQPGFRFRTTGALLTNFHLPRGSPLMLACAFGGRELVLAACRYAVEQRYRFYSYGDCMLIV